MPGPRGCQRPGYSSSNDPRDLQVWPSLPVVSKNETIFLCRWQWARQLSVCEPLLIHAGRCSPEVWPVSLRMVPTCTKSTSTGSPDQAASVELPCQNQNPVVHLD